MLRLPRIEGLLGVFIAEADEAALQRLIDGSVREDEDLEFKSNLYGGSDQDRRELAKDVAGLANHRGGLLIIGIDDDQGTAARLTTVALSEDAELRMRQIVADLVSPAPQIDLRPVPSAGNSEVGYYLLAVPRSLLAPHAVRINDALRYHRRDGTRTRPLYESEVADAYRSRFASATSRRQRLEEAITECRQAHFRQEGTWLVLGVSPQVPGEMGWGAGALHRVREWMQARLDELPRGLALSGSYAHHIQPGYRRFIHADRLAGGQSVSLYYNMELHRDGTVVAAVNVHLEVPQGQAGQLTGTFDQWLTVEVVALLQLLSGISVELAGCWGDGSVHAELRPADGQQLRLLSQYGIGEAYRNHDLMSPVMPVSLRSVELEEVAQEPASRLIAAKGLVEDLVSAFGFAQCDYITDEGALATSRFNRSWREVLSSWEANQTMS